jgi:hypothetical protein
MNLINWLLNSKIHANMYFEFLYGNTMEILRNVTHKKLFYCFFLFLFLLKGLRKINEKKKKKKNGRKQKSKRAFLFFYYIYSFFFIFLFFFRGTRSTLTG